MMCYYLNVHFQVQRVNRHSRLQTDRVTSVGITLGSLQSGIEFRWGEVFRIPPYLPCGPPSLLGYYSWDKSGRGLAVTTHPTSTEVKERVQLYFYSPFVTV